MQKKSTIWIGFEPRESDGFAVTRHSINKFLTTPIPIYGIVLDRMKARGIFTREQSVKNGVLWDEISAAPCATEFSISRFLIKELAKTGWALFMDSDMMARTNFARLFEGLDPSKAVYCVKHDYRPKETVKMDGQIQTQYEMKNWSSFFILNCDHPANKALTVDLVNSVPGRDLHQFCWIPEGEKQNLIGELDERWNWLVGHSTAPDPYNVHFTTGVPSMAGYENVEFADEWRENLYEWALKR